MESNNFGQLTDKIEQLLETVSALQKENAELNKALKFIKNNHNEEENQKLLGLEEEIRKYKRENKILKENEKLIKNKVERLSVKLDQIEI